MNHNIKQQIPIVYKIDDIIRVSWYNNININLLGMIKRIDEDGMKFVILFQNGTYQKNVRNQDLKLILSKL